MNHNSRKDFEEKRKFGEAYDFIRGMSFLLGLNSLLFGILTFIFGDEVFGSGNAPQYEQILELPWAPESWGTFSAACGVLIIVGAIFDNQRQIGSGCVLMGLWSYTLAVLIAKDCIEHQTSFGVLAVLFFAFVGTAMFGRARLGFNWRACSGLEARKRRSKGKVPKFLE